MTTKRKSLERAPDGCYQFRDADMRFTAYAVFPFDPAALALDNDALMNVADASVEEIDVNAFSLDEAWEVAKQALASDYDKGGRIVHVTEQVGWYW